MFEIVKVTLFSGVLAWLGIIDFKSGLIPNKIVYPAIIGALLLNIYSDEVTILSALIGGFSTAVFFLIVALLLKNMGMGDVKLGFLMGLMVGFPESIIALVSGVFFGGLAAIFFVVSRKKNRKDSMPYGPYLVIGTLFTLTGIQFSLFDFLYRL